MLTRHIVRIRCGPLRAAIWTAWFPFAAGAFLIVATVNGALLRYSTWQCLLTIYLVGVDGLP